MPEYTGAPQHGDVIASADRRDLQIVQSPMFMGVLRACRRLPRGKGAVARRLGRLVLGREKVLQAEMPAGFEMLWSAASVEALVAALTIGWDENVLQTLLGLVGDGDVLYDIGANAGYMSLSVANRHAGARIFAFEPLPNLASSLGQSARLNGFDKVSVIEAVLTDTDGEMDFYLPSHSIHASLKSREANATRLTVKAYKLDSLVQAGTIPPPQVIKVDVEGAELSMFRGAEATLRQYLPALVFESDDNTERFGLSPSDVVNYLFSLGYTDIRRLRPRSIEADRIEPGQKIVQYGDFIATARR